jgi:hypothetical protein
MGLERRQPDADRAGAEELRERRRDSFDPGLAPREVHVGIDGVPHPRQDAPLGLELVTRDAQRLPEPQPRLDPARSGGRAVVVDDPLDPHAPDLELGAVREDRRVLDGDAALVVEAIGDPALKLLAGELAGVHAHVEAVKVVIPRAQPPQALGELLRRPRLRRARTLSGGDAHSSSSRPS